MTIEELDQIAESTRAGYAKYDQQINVCMGTGCLSQHSDKLRDALTEEVKKQGKNAFVRRTGCMVCARRPTGVGRPRRSSLPALQRRPRRSSHIQSRRRAVAELQCNLREHFDQQCTWCWKLRPHRSGKNRRLHCARRLQGSR